MFRLDDTIAALASAHGPGGRGIIRCCGPQVVEFVEQNFRPSDAVAWKSARRAFRHPGHWKIAAISRDLPVDVCLWPTPRSYTGQIQAEIHALGSPPLLEAMLSDLFVAGARPAQAGEFTLRAFLAGRVDLVQAEAVLGVIDATDQQQLQTALSQLAGGVSQRLSLMRTEFLDLLADLEAGLDFTEEGIEFVSRSVLVERIVAARGELQRLLAGAQARMRHNARPRVVLAGRPNAGKSTLFNSLVKRSAALVSPIPGTTRDYLTAEVEWHGLQLELVDTAGWEDTSDEILKLALDLRGRQLEQADLVLQCIAADDPDLHSDMAQSVKSQQISQITVITKVDVETPSQARGCELVSARDNTGIETLRSAIIDRLRALQSGESDILGSTSARCRDSLERAIAALDRAASLAADGGGDEFLATDVREALDELGRITGAIYTDDLLDRIFSKFCIGK